MGMLELNSIAVYLTNDYVKIIKQRKKTVLGSLVDTNQVFRDGVRYTLLVKQCFTEEELSFIPHKELAYVRVCCSDGRRTVKVDALKDYQESCVLYDLIY